MVTIALIGGDGAGKTTIANILQKSSPFPVKYLYMGPSVLSGNKTLPTARLARFLKLRAIRKDAEESDKTLTESPPSHDFHYKPLKHGAVWDTMRSINRIAEASYRYLVSLGYQLSGYVVIYDRHFLFHVRYPSSKSQDRNYMKLLRHLEYWFFNYCYPKPDLVIFLDAPSDVLYRRKGEADIPRLNRHRLEMLERGKTMDNFICIDAAQPIEEVLAEVTQHIINFRESRKKGK